MTRWKLSWGIAIIAFVFTLLGIVSIVQFYRLGKSDILNDAISRIEICRILEQNVDEHIFKLSQQLIDPNGKIAPTEKFNAQVYKPYIDTVATWRDISNFHPNISPSMFAMLSKAVDSTLVSYSIFRSNAFVIDSLFALPHTNKLYWYNYLYKPSSMQFRYSVNQLAKINQVLAAEKSQLIQRNFLAMAFPIFIIIVAGLLLILSYYLFIVRKI